MTGNLFAKPWLISLALLPGTIQAQKDTLHYSAVFNGPKPYRIFLPAEYEAQPAKKYPVIYYFHGNKGDHRLPFDGVASLVDSSAVILVCWNGRSVPEDDRPYNIGYHSNINYAVQFKDYFPELVHHIDSSYRTQPDRIHRAVIGHSMGGFMSFFLAGKYPDMISAAVNSKGSPEFFVGMHARHTLYQQRHMFRNLKGLHLRFQNGGPDEELVHLNTEVHKAASQEPFLHYDYEAYGGPHELNFEQFRDAFRFTAEALKHPLPKPDRWHHADIYPEFDIWGYHVTSNLKTPGFIELRGVTTGGLTTMTRKWQPDGGGIPGTELHIKTSPLYRPNTNYTLLDFNRQADTIRLQTVTTDASGALRFSTDYQPHVFGIYNKNSPPEVVLADFQAAGGKHLLPHQQPATLRLRLLNRGGKTARGLSIKLSTTTPGVSIQNPHLQLREIPAGQLAWSPAAFQVTAANEPPRDGSSPYIRFQVEIIDQEGHVWKDEFESLAMFNVPEFTEIGVDDGDSEIFGSGNGNNIAEPGETVMIYQYSHRTKLYFEDPYIESEKLHDDLQPDKWGDGYALSSLIRISKDCPPGHVIRFLACYEVKEWKTIKRNVTWGTFSITVGGK
ncbi:alpha/beta hydrolase-fold protein [Chitinophaga sp.]|uniref:alpha/beta hydrolase-fold protein n=1 Tax=Chitinophaga sp. TaxID=1869181 RepID=UPI0031D3C5C9